MTALAQKERLGNASATYEDGVLAVDTGRVQRTWNAINSGLATVSLHRSGSGFDWIDSDRPAACDWKLIGVLDERSRGVVGDVTIRQVRDVLYSSDHIEVEVPFIYEDEGFEVRYRVWVYPDAPGVRTQLRLRALREFDPAQLPGYLGPSYAERLPLSHTPEQGRAIGYYDDTQHRNFDETPILKELRVDVERGETNDWASILQLESNGSCLSLVKESHKCVRQDGVDTGHYYIRPDLVRVTGLCLTSAHYNNSPWHRQERFRDCWATWCILTDGDFEKARDDVRAFDRARFPFRPERDALVMANTWGSRGAGEGSRSAAEQTNVLNELESCADLGIDILQIDDGWQCEPNADKPFEVDWTPHPVRWPDGWSAVREASRKLGVALGLWQPWWTPVEAILRNREEGGFRRFKIDFMCLHNADEIEGICDKARKLVEQCGPECGINWDATEGAPRMGYFFGRDYGNIYLANRPARTREQVRGRHVAYIPRLVLRDAWHLARHMNLNQIQIAVQNVNQVDPDFSNAHKHRHDYCFAISMMGVPIFFQETHLYDEEARKQLRPLVRLYKQHRDRLFEGVVDPIGDDPDDASWTGFHNHHPDSRTGYLTIFREIDNTCVTRSISIPRLSGKRIRLTDLVTETTREVCVPDDGHVEFEIEQPAGFLFLQYQTI